MFMIADIIFYKRSPPPFLAEFWVGGQTCCWIKF